MGNKSLGRNALYNIIYKVINVIFPLISTAYVARVLLADGVGRVSAVQNNVSYFLILATLGIPVYGLREIAKSKDELDNRSNLFSELFTLNFILTVLAFLLFNWLVFCNDYFKNEIVLYEIFGLTILLNTFNVDWLFYGLEEYGYIAVRSILIKTASFLLLVFFVKGQSDIYVYAIIQVVGITGNYFLNIIRCRKYVSFRLKKINLLKHIKPLLYLALCSVSTELYAKMDITMLDYLKTNDVVGYYANSQKIINLVVTTLVAVTAVFMPRLSYLFDKDKDEFNKILKVGFELMVVVSFPACIGLILISEPLVFSFLGSDFSRASVTVSILSFMVPLKCVGDLICFQVMMCAKQERLLMMSYFVTMVVNLINNLILIPKYGAEGAAIASVISEVLAFGFVFYFSRKYFKLHGVHKTIIKTIVCTIVMAAVIYPINLLQISDYLKLLIEVCVGIFTFVVACIVTKHAVVLQYIGMFTREMRRRNK